MSIILYSYKKTYPFKYYNITHTHKMSTISFKNILIVITLVVSYGNAANILVMIPLPYVSHTMNFLPIFKELANRGHNVTVVSPYPQKTPLPNLTDIVVPNIMNDLFSQPSVKELIGKSNLIFHFFQVWKFGFDCMTKALQFEQVQKLIKDTDSKFDLVVAEIWFIQEPFVAFGHKFNAPVIGIVPGLFFPKAAYLSGNHLSTAYTKNNDRLTFLERAINFIVNYWDIAVGDLYYLNKQDAIMREYFIYPGSENLPPLQNMLRNISLTLMDQNIAIGYPVPLHKNVILYGGINVHGADKLPADLQKILDNTKEGVIYLSFGSFFSVSFLEPFMQDAILSALGKLKYKVLMKLEDPSLLQNYSSKNIEVRRWFPQPSILAHPNCKLFITHGGLHGLMEAIYHAVPLVVIPFMGDQNFNARFIETIGIGYRLDKQTITEDQIVEAVDEVLNNPSYRENIKERSAIFKDQPISTMDNVIYWIEYVIRHKGAPHLRPAVLDLPWYQYFMLDVIVFYLLIIFLIVYIIKKVVSLLMRCVKRTFFSTRVSKKSNQRSKKE